MGTPISVNIDAGWSTADSFPDTTGVSAAWDFHISKGNNSRSGELRGDWDQIASTTPSQARRRVKDVGTVPSSVTVALDKNINAIRVRCYVPSDGWTFRALRHLVQP